MKKNKKNAVLYKEMTVDIKKPKAMLIILIVNLMLMPIALGFFIGMFAGGIAGNLSYRVCVRRQICNFQFTSRTIKCKLGGRCTCTAIRIAAI